MGAKAKKPKPTEYEKALAEVADKKNQIYRENFFPVEDRLVAEASTDRTDAIRKRTIGGVSAKTGLARLGTLENASRVVDPSSGKFLSVASGAESVAANAGANAAIEGFRAGRARQDNLRGNVAKFGVGLAGDAQTGLEALAETATRVAMTKAAGYTAQREAELTSLGQFMGVAAGGAYDKYRGYRRKLNAQKEALKPFLTGEP